MKKEGRTREARERKIEREREIVYTIKLNL